MFCCAHHKCSHLSPYDTIIVPLTIFPMLCLLFLWLILSITGKPVPPPLQPFCPTPYHPPLWQPSVCSLYLQVWFCFLFVGLFICFRFYMSEIIWYLSFSFLFISFSIISSRPIHVVTNDKISFFFVAVYYSFIERGRERKREIERCIYDHIFLIHSSISGHRLLACLSYYK